MNANLFITTPDPGFIDNERLQAVIAFKSDSLSGGNVYEEFEYHVYRIMYHRLRELGATNEEIRSGAWL